MSNENLLLVNQTMKEIVVNCIAYISLFQSKDKKKIKSNVEDALLNIKSNIDFVNTSQDLFSELDEHAKKSGERFVHYSSIIQRTYNTEKDSFTKESEALAKQVSKELFALGMHFELKEKD